MTPRIPTAGRCAARWHWPLFFWWVNFGLHWVNFWIGMGTAASVLALLSFWFAGVPMKRPEWTGRAVLIGLVSAALPLCDLCARQYAFRMAVPLCAASGVGHLRYPP